MFTQSPNKKIAQILLEAYLLDHQFNKAKTFYASLPETIRKQLNKKREFKIWLNAFSQIKPKDYLNLKVLFFKLDQEELFSLPEKTYYETIFALIEKRYQDAKNKLTTLSS